MKNLFNRQAIAPGLAIFSMFFGAGNIVFPLAVGQFAGDKNITAMSGLILTAVIMPILGILAILLCNGSYKQFFARLGKIPGFIIALIIISLLGPFGSAPRCIALSYSTFCSSFYNISPALFGAIACSVIFLCCIKKKYILTILGRILTPLLLISLAVIIILGLFQSKNITPSEITHLSTFIHGLKEGYKTMDLLAALFFSSMILNMLKLDSKKHPKPQSHIKTALQASLLGVILLGTVYIGFSYLAAFNGASLNGVSQDELIAAIVLKIAGPYAGLLISSMITLACLTTTIALITAFTDFLKDEVFKQKVKYEILLFASLFVTFIVSTLEFDGISNFLSPILQICYPFLIGLTLYNIISHTIKLKSKKALKGSTKKKLA